MSNLFLQYMHERVKREEEDIHPEKGPVITLSREYGCYGSEIGSKLAKKINSNKKIESDEWIFVSHQVLHDAAQALEATPQDISHIFGAEEKGVFDDLVSVFSKDKYLSNTKIKRAIAQIVRSYSEQGNSIIVGRAGCVIAKHIERSIHIKVFAPLDWRISQIKKRFNLTDIEATNLVKETDKRRETFMEFYRGNKPDSELFDMVLNRATLTTEEIVNQIYYFAQERGLV
ncbi:MAG: cytidylate kinase-like family protein [Bacteroidales bacterium]|jgi:cytidylate kinase|nr:cytidylate kinase-like family protein [Bacteroidales bacterium]MDD4672444.1 cytidylate kinase-like family protein [Bacteroidales bacterium]MDY0347281.1 cytidylate kinase-like family protein [Tenuifilaceae bacterium]